MHRVTIIYPCMFLFLHDEWTSYGDCIPVGGHFYLAIGEKTPCSILYPGTCVDKYSNNGSYIAALATASKDKVRYIH